MSIIRRIHVNASDMDINGSRFHVAIKTDSIGAPLVSIGDFNGVDVETLVARGVKFTNYPNDPSGVLITGICKTDVPADCAVAINLSQEGMSGSPEVLKPINRKSSLITYKIVSDRDGKLKAAAKLSCNFWNKFIKPNSPIVVRLGTFYSDNDTIARAYKPYTRNGIMYGNIEFNTKFLSTFSDSNIATTIIHEIGHTLRIGFGKWLEMFDLDTGIFYKDYIEKLPSLEEMRVELDYGPGTELAHWDEERHGEELMTGLKNHEPEHILPVTIDVMELLGHDVIETLSEKTMLVDIIEELRKITFTRIEEAKMLDLDYYEKTELLEVIHIK